MILDINSDCSFDIYMKRVFNYLDIDIPKQTIDDIIESINVNYMNEEQIKDKIKNKIEELKDLCLICQFRDSFCKDLKERTQCVSNAIIKVLENLLKENKND